MKVEKIKTKRKFYSVFFFVKKIVYDLVCREKRDNSFIQLNKKKKKTIYN